MPRAARALCGIALLVVGGIGARVVWQSVRSRPEFTISAVHVTGAAARIADDVRALAGVPAGANTWDIDLPAVRERVLHHAWVAEAEVRRELPGAIVVAVEERRALAVVHVEGVPYGVDRRGQLFAPLDAAQAGALPRITGLDELRRTATASAGHGREEQAAQAARMLRRAAALVRVAGRGNRISEVRIDPVHGLTVLTEELGDVPVRFGWKRWREKERRLGSVMALWAGREAELEAVSLVFRERVVVQLRQGASVEAAAGREPSGT